MKNKLLKKAGFYLILLNGVESSVEGEENS